MNHVFEIIDKTGRKIRLTKRQWKHITVKHSAVARYFEEIKETLKKPDSIIESEDKFSEKECIYFYYKYFKFFKSPYNYMLIIVKHLNGEGHIITAYLEKSIK